MKKSRGKNIFLILLFIYLLIPIAAIIIFSIAGRWDTSIFPENYTLKYFQTIFNDAEFAKALIRTAAVSIITSVATVSLMVPCIYLATVHYIKLEKLFEILSLIPFVLPGVILAISLIQVYSGGLVNISGTVWILLGSYFVLCFPYTYQSVRNSFRAIDASKLVEAAMMLGCNESEAFLKVVLPNIIKGVVSAMLLSISILFGEFVLANLLVGNNYETVQIYLFKSLNTDGHVASAVVTVYMAVVFIISYLAIFLTRGSERKKEVKM